MPGYKLTFEAEQDLLDIALFTLEHWGLEQVIRYEAAFIRHFEALARGEALTNTPLSHRPEIQVCHVEHHYVFSFHEKNRPVLVLSIFHEKMDLVEQLANRLDRLK